MERMKVQWDANETNSEELSDMKLDHPFLTASYIANNNVTRSKDTSCDRTLIWAKNL